MKSSKLAERGGKTAQLTSHPRRRRSFGLSRNEVYKNTRNSQNQQETKPAEIIPNKPKVVLIKSMKLRTQARPQSLEKTTTPKDQLIDKLDSDKKFNSYYEKDTLGVTQVNPVVISLDAMPKPVPDKDYTVNNEIFEKSDSMSPEKSGMEIETPSKKFVIDTTKISEYEERVNSEFFLNKLNKTPERFMRIRNFILDKWEQTKPNYLTKVASRTGLVGCGDVNAIGRIHTWLEKIEAINVGIEPPKHYTSRLSGILQAHRAKSGRLEKGPETIGRKRKSVTSTRRIETEFKPIASDDQGYTLRQNKALKLDKLDEDFCRSAPGCYCSYFCPCKKNHKKTLMPPLGYSYNDCHWACSKINLPLGISSYAQKIKILSYNHEKLAPFEIKIDKNLLGFLESHFLISKGKCFGNLGGCFDEQSNVLYLNMCFPVLSFSDSSDKHNEAEFIANTLSRLEFESRGFRMVGFYGPVDNYSENEFYVNTCQVSKLIVSQESESPQHNIPFIRLNVDFNTSGCWAEYIEYDKLRIGDLGVPYKIELSTVQLVKFDSYYLDILNVLLCAYKTNLILKTDEKGMNIPINSFNEPQSNIIQLISCYFKGYTPMITNI